MKFDHLIYFLSATAAAINLNIGETDPDIELYEELEHEREIRALVEERLSLSKSGLGSQYTPRFTHSSVLGHCTESNFQVIGHVGDGNFGSVFEAMHLPTQKRLALKVLKGIPRDDKEESFPKKLNHPNIMKHYCSFRRSDGKIVFISDYFSGGRLRTVLQKGKGKVRTKKMIKWIAQMYSAAKHMHDRSIAHRDYHLDNLLIDSKKNIQIIDFGLAQKFSWSSTDPTDVEYRLEAMGREYRKIAHVVHYLCPLMNSANREACKSFHKFVGTSDRNRRIQNCYDNYERNKNHQLFKDFDWSTLPN